MVFFNFSYFIIPTSPLVDYMLYDVYMHSLAYIYIAVFCSVVLQLVYRLDYQSYSCSLCLSHWTQCPPSFLVNPVLCVMTSLSSIPLPLCHQQSWSLQLHPGPPFNIPSLLSVPCPLIGPRSHTGPDNIDGSLGTLTFDLATNWGISTQTVLRPPMAAVNATTHYFDSGCNFLVVLNINCNLIQFLSFFTYNLVCIKKVTYFFGWWCTVSNKTVPQKVRFHLWAKLQLRGQR